MVNVRVRSAFYSSWLLSICWLRARDVRNFNIKESSKWSHNYLKNMYLSNLHVMGGKSLGGFSSLMHVLNNVMGHNDITRYVAIIDGPWNFPHNEWGFLDNFEIHVIAHTLRGRSMLPGYMIMSSLERLFAFVYISWHLAKRCSYATH